VTKLVVLFSIFQTRLKASQLTLYMEIIAVCSQIHTKHINTLCGLNVELLFVKPGGTFNDRWALEGLIILTMNAYGDAVQVACALYS
jgi:hypothetical protein